MGYTYTKTFFIGYLKFKLNWASSSLLATKGNPACVAGPTCSCTQACSLAHAKARWELRSET